MDKHYAQVLGVTLVKKYRVSFEDIVEAHAILETPVIWEGDLDSPVFKRNDKLYLDNINKEVEITKVVRSTDGTYLYYTSHKVGETLENEITEQSRLEAEEKLKSISKKEDSEKSEKPFLKIDKKNLLDSHSIQLQLLNSYKKAHSPKELIHLLSSVTNLNSISKWNKEYQNTIDEKYKEIQKFVLSNITKSLNNNDLYQVNGWTEVLCLLENSMIDDLT